MRSRFRRYYGDQPLHLLSLLACFSLSGYAARELVNNHVLAVAVWFVGAAVGHDLLLFPLYALVDRSLLRLAHRPRALPVTAPWLNYVRFPAAVSGLLFLVFAPSILRLSGLYQTATTLSPDRFVWNWLAITGALFLVSAVAYALRLRRLRSRS